VSASGVPAAICQTILKNRPQTAAANPPGAFLVSTFTVFRQQLPFRSTLKDNAKDLGLQHLVYNIVALLWSGA